MVNCEVKLEKGKSSNKLYFDKKLRQFTNAVKRCGVLEDLKIRRTFMKPSLRRKLAPKISTLKWKFYK
jgi:ribosomal protein S21